MRGGVGGPSGGPLAAIERKLDLIQWEIAELRREVHNIRR
jgi:hypothetical protein